MIEKNKVSFFMTKNLNIAIVIPVYKEVISKNEQLSLKQLQRYLPSYDIFFMTPESLKNIPEKFPRKNFADHYFSNIHTYSQLLLSEHFYQEFNDYTHILIYQLDALVFSDQLGSWAKKEVSYIGAPWFSSQIGSATSPTKELGGGNGGLSLRSIPESLKVLQIVKQQAKYNFPYRTLQWAWFGISLLLGRTKKKWLQIPADQYPFNEDGFWSFEAPKYSPSFRVATQKESLQFSFETNPQKCFDLNNQQLPFGVHAWEKYDKEFWLKKLSSLHIE
jgi:hypothetical protein